MSLTQKGERERRETKSLENKNMSNYQARRREKTGDKTTITTYEMKSLKWAEKKVEEMDRKKHSIFITIKYCY